MISLINLATLGASRPLKNEKTNLVIFENLKYLLTE